MVAELTAYSDLLESEELRFMSELIHILRVGHKVFKELEGEAINQISQRPGAAARVFPNVSKDFYATIYTGIQEIESSGS